jgi:hypothetical protein
MNPQDGVAQRNRLIGSHDHAGLARQVLVAGDAAEAEPVIHAGRHAETRRDADGGERDIVGLLQHRDGAAAVIGDVELARQAVQLAMMQDEMMQRAGVRAGVQQLVRIDPGGRAAGDVAHIVRPRPARGQADLGQADQHLRRVRGRYFADLQIGPCGHIGKTTTEVGGDVGDPVQLVGRHDAAGDAQAAHEAVLGRGDIEQAVELGQEHVRALGELAFGGQCRDFVEPVQRVLLPLGLLLRHQLAAFGEYAVLGRALQVQRIGRRRRPAGCERQTQRAA